MTLTRLAHLALLFFCFFAPSLLLGEGAELSQAERELERPSEAIPMGRHRFIFGFFQNVKINDDPEALTFVPKGYGIYSFQGSDWKFSTLLAGIFNRADLSYRLAGDHHVFTGIETLFIFAGDKPRIDGQTSEDLEFKGHRLAAFWGYRLQTGEERGRLDYWVRYDLDRYFFYDRPASTLAFTPPKDFTEHALTAAIEGPAKPPSELFEFGVRPVLWGSARYRQGYERWGTSTFSPKNRYYLAGTTGFSLALQATQDFVFVAKSQGSIVYRADRLNAIRDGSLRLEYIGMLTGDIRADRTWTTEAGIRWYPFHHRQFGLRPFGHTIYFRELTPVGRRTNFAGGGGLKVFGAISRSVFSTLSYATMSGDRDDMETTHEIRLDLSYSFAP